MKEIVNFGENIAADGPSNDFIRNVWAVLLKLTNSWEFALTSLTHQFVTPVAFQ